jgi:hypothetical protein
MSLRHQPEALALTKEARMKRINFTAFVLLLAIVALPIPASSLTRGEVRDIDAAASVERCATQYLGRRTSDANTEVWIMCLHVSAELAERDKLNVARQVLRIQGYNVFEIEEKPARFSGKADPIDLTPDMIKRIQSGN